MLERGSGAMITMASAAARQADRSSAAHAAAKLLAADALSWITGVALDIAGGKIMV
jgi:short-subunit dehydrogenase